jgi:hypothetical protein
LYPLTGHEIVAVVRNDKMCIRIMYMMKFTINDENDATNSTVTLKVIFLKKIYMKGIYYLRIRVSVPMAAVLRVPSFSSSEKERKKERNRVPRSGCNNAQVDTANNPILLLG